MHSVYNNSRQKLDAIFKPFQGYFPSLKTICTELKECKMAGRENQKLIMPNKLLLNETYGIVTSVWFYKPDERDAIF